MSQTVIGIFDNASEAQDAIEQLVKKGFDRSSIDLSAANSGSASGGTTSGSTTSDLTTSDFTTSDSTTSDSTTSGSTYSGSSSTIGNAFNEGASKVGNALHEGESKIGNFFKSLFGGDDDDTTSTHSTYSKAAERRTVVTVHAKSSEEAEDAADILDDYGAVNVDENSSAYGAASTGTTGSTAVDQSNTGTSIPVIEEQLQVGKRTVETGGVRLRSRIVERPVEESLRLREERVYVDRTPVNRAVTGTELENFKEGTIELTESAEVPVVAKEAFVKEEVRLGKEVNERNETIRDTVRSTEVDVENIEASTKTSGTTSSDSYNSTGSSTNSTTGL